MSIITLNNLTKQYESTIILDNINFTLNKNEKVAIVGRNGAGKSTLAKIIYGLESYDKGDIFILSNTKIGYFSQESFVDSNDTVINEMKKVFKKQIEIKKQIDELADKINDNSSTKTLDKYNELLLCFEEIGGYTYSYKIESILNRFGFKQYYHHNVNNLSGGQRTRLALTKLLLSEPDVLILDEPTNHLDIETVEFLESFLKKYPNELIIISHDRYFLNQVVNVVYEIEFNKGIIYKGNYDKYLSLKFNRYEQLQKQFNIQQKHIKKEQEFIEKNIVRASTTKRAQSRRKQLEKLEIIKNPKIDDKSINVNFDFNVQSGNLVLDISDLSIGYDQAIVEDINFQVLHNEKVAILGPNGIGKSTLLKTINKFTNPLKGKIKYGTNVKIAYFDQDMAMLNSNKTLLDELWDENRQMLEKDIRNVLGSFMFTQDDVYKIVSDLSGGEKVRLALSKLFLKKANFLILDEVTNHLDINSREVLESALINFKGTILLVSHDRFFINKVATKIVEINSNHIDEYNGDYQYYLEKREQIANNNNAEVNQNNVNDYQKQKENQRKFKKLKKQVETLELDIANIEEEISNLKNDQLKEEVYSDYEKAHKIQEDIDFKEKELEEKLHLWSKLVEEVK